MNLRAMTRATAILLAAGLPTLFGPVRAAAQDYDMSAGWGGGYISYAPFVDQGAASPAEIGLGGTWVALLQAESWHLGRWVGLRLGGFYSRGTVTYPTAEKQTSIYGAELAGLVRVLPPAPDRMGTGYLIGGGGLMWYQLGEGTAVPIADANVIYDPGDRRQWMLLGGAGFELLTGVLAFDGELGIRFEGVDQISLSRPFREIGGPDPEMMHNLRFSVTLFSGVPKLF